MGFLYIGEGPNDELIVPIILASGGSDCEQAEFKMWKSLHVRGRAGFKKKAKFAFILARESGRRGVVATLDADKDPHRINHLRSAREEDRQDTSRQVIPIILGQANPELEAWLLDDAEAVKSGLNISSQTSVPSPKVVGDVKVALNEIFELSELDARRDCLVAVAERVSLRSTRAANATGLADFWDDASNELGE